MADKTKDVLIRFRTDTKELEKSEDSFDKINKSINEQDKLVQSLTEKEKALTAQRLKANDPKQIAKLNSELANTKKALNSVSSETTTVENKFQKLNESANSLGASIGIAFGVGAIIQFAKESVLAFTEAELNAKKLEFSVKQIANGTNGAYDILLAQSAKLQDTSIFSDDDIQRSQTALLQYGLTTDQVNKLIPAIIDLASATGDTLGSATDRIISGINGQTRGLKDVGLQFKDTGDKTKNYEKILDSLNRKFEGSTAVALETTGGKIDNLKNQFGDLMEVVGEFVVKYVEGFIKVVKITQTFPRDIFEQIFSRDSIRFSKFVEETANDAKKKIEELNGLNKAELNKKLADEKDYLNKLLIARKESTKESTTSEINVLIANQVKIRNATESKINDILIKEKEASEIANKLEADKAEKLKKEAEKRNKIREEEIRKETEGYRQAEKEFDLQQKHKFDTLNEIADEQLASNAQKDGAEKAFLKMQSDNTQAELKLSEDAIEQDLQNRRDAQDEELQLEQEHQQQLQNIRQQTADASQAIATTLLVNQQELNDIETQSKIDAIDRQLKAGQISEEKANKEKQKLILSNFEDQKKTQLQLLAINTAAAIVRAYASLDPVSATIAATGIVTLAGLQAEKIDSTPPPKFGKGGIVKGKKHSEGGEIIEAERDEMVVNAFSSKRHKDVLNAINKNMFDKYIQDKYINPLMLNYSAFDKKSSSNSSSQSLSFDDYYMRKTMKDSAMKSADYIVKGLKQNSYNPHRNWA